MPARSHPRDLHAKAFAGALRMDAKIDVDRQVGVKNSLLEYLKANHQPEKTWFDSSDIAPRFRFANAIKDSASDLAGATWTKTQKHLVKRYSGRRSLPGTLSQQSGEKER